MDKEQVEIQFIGFFGIFKEYFSIISSYRKIFSQITLSLILPLSFIFLAHIEITEFLFGEIINNEDALNRTQIGSQKYSNILDILSSEWTAFWLFKFAYFILFLILSLLSTSAVVYTIACIYTAKTISFKKVISVVPKVWKRLMVTFIWNFVIVLAINLVALLVLILWAITLGPSPIGLLVFVIFVLIYIIGFVYISIVWNLASVISVLEDVYGIQAMCKGNDLIKGKIGVCVAIFLVQNFCFIGIQQRFEVSVVRGDSFGEQIGYGVMWLVLLTILILFGFVIQTVIYFVCKSHHHENIGKSMLADHLEVYLGDYVPLKFDDVQLDHFDV